jgi:septum site-determining protein MinC
MPVLSQDGDLWVVALDPECDPASATRWVDDTVRDAAEAVDNILLRVADEVSSDVVVAWTDALLRVVDGVQVEMSGSTYVHQMVASASADVVREAHFVEGHLRSGRSVRVDGDLTVLGDIHAGAEVIASGNVFVLGTLRGVAHAGASGDADAFVFALHLFPTQVRIADRITILPDRGTTGPEIVRVLDGAVVVSALNGSAFARRKTS